MNAPSTIPAHVQRIALAGFMGSGKTTVGKALAARLDWQFADLDEVVTQRAGATVPQIFAERGEAALRVAEVSAQQSLLDRTGFVIALGGGAPETDAIRTLLKDTPGTAVIHLHAPFDVLYDRCTLQAQDPGAVQRPLLGERNAAAARYKRRFALYAQVSHHKADAGANSPEIVAAQIIALLQLPVASLYPGD